MEEEKKTWGGKRQGAGRPPGAKNSTYKEHRKVCNMRAYPEEWELIKIYAKLVKMDIERAKKILELW